MLLRAPVFDEFGDPDKHVSEPHYPQFSASLPPKPPETYQIEPFFNLAHQKMKRAYTLSLRNRDRNTA
jgi:hypothetical protein